VAGERRIACFHLCIATAAGAGTFGGERTGGETQSATALVHEVGMS